MGKFGRGNVWQIYSFQAFGEKRFGELISRLAKRLLIVYTNLDGFSLANYR